ncbi:carbon-nitrogen hydrolase family protein [Tateyamaria pelophila]|uniref:carbon-nitrogen hydrolase family protein n=1 Tax=Tateyamaria pelophila TaxID=328415 RepID=UPI001CBFE36C|nr:carbon-nitrogen hydrolase family protein [Tateyamaria pelophila]
MTGQDTLTVLACQIEVPATPDAAARDKHLAQSASKVRAQLRTTRADLVVLPELSSIDYSRAAFDALADLSEPLDGPSFDTWQSVALELGVYVSYSFARRDGDQTYISIAVVAPDGTLIGHYDKLHLCQYGASMEKEYFSAGDHIFTFKVKDFTLAPIICYDIRIPELSRVLTLDRDVDVILHCGAYYRDESFMTWHNFAIARAMENQVFLLSLNRAGKTWGNSIFCPPWMDENTLPLHFAETGEEFRHVEITKEQKVQARTDYTFLKDRLPDYRVL